MPLRQVGVRDSGLKRASELALLDERPPLIDTLRERGELLVVFLFGDGSSLLERRKALKLSHHIPLRGGGCEGHAGSFDSLGVRAVLIRAWGAVLNVEDQEDDTPEGDQADKLPPS